MSRFLKEIPLSLLSTGALFKKEQTEEEPKVSAYRQAKQAFATKAFAATKPAQQFTVTKGKGPGYDVGDRVRHIKFGEGLVTQITEGGLWTLIRRARRRCLPCLQNCRKLTKIALCA